MPDNAKEYHRLTYARRRSGFGFASMYMSLWLGKDHLLCIENARYNFRESYKRFYFRDIQAITIRRNQQRLVANIVLGAVIGLLGLIFLGIVNSANGNIGMLSMAYVIAGIAGLFLLILIVNTLMGPTVVCHVRTAVQTEELNSLNRLGRAHKFLNRVRPLIAEAQGRMAPEEVQALMNQMSASGGALPTYPQPLVGAPAAPPGTDGLPVP